jgi:NAD(P)-dependent dehydrogenase (short-subunit alcohol dehydrogenase family)
MRVEGKIAIVTGASVGIGRAISELLAAEGATVYACNRTAPEQPFTHERIHWVSLDASDINGWQRVVGQVVAEQGRVDILVNNAGMIGAYEPLHSIDLDAWDQTVALNLSGTMYGMRTVIPHMQKSGGGSIVNISSIWGVAGIAGAAAYQATKGGVITLSRHAAIAYVGDKIRVNCVNPGITWTPLVERQGDAINAAVVAATPMKRWGEAHETAYAVLYLASDEATYTTGTELDVDGGYLAQ